MTGPRMSQVKPEGTAGQYPKVNPAGDGWLYDVPAGGSLTVDDEGVSQGTATTLNFTGGGVTATVASGVATINVPGGSGTVGPYQVKKRSSTAVPITATSFTAVDTALDVTVSAATGDLILVGVNGATSHSAANGLMAFDVATIVSGAVVNWISGGNTEGTTGFREQSPTANEIRPLTGTLPYVVAAGDLSTGSVTFRIFAKTNAGTLTVNCESPFRSLTLWAKNLLH